MNHSLEAALRALLDPRGQSHVLKFWDELAEGDREVLAREIRDIDFDELDSLLADASATSVPEAGVALEPVDPAPPAGAGDPSEEGAARALGEGLLSAGQVACVTVAGGQASRLGLDGPKGAYPIGPVSSSSLFQILSEKVLVASRRYGVEIPWWIMTSEANDEETRAFFAEHDHFGLALGQVHFFAQRMIPAVDSAGRLLLAEKHHLFRNPNGHGGLLSGLATCGALAQMAERGIEHVLTCQVDNPLIRFVDPLFLGRHVAMGAEASCKVVPKRDADEKVGVIGLKGGRYGCIEYSDLPAELREKRDAEGRLAFRAGNIAAHAFGRGFLERIGGGDLRLPYHCARKKLRALDENGNAVEIEGNKFETFVFDALPRAETVLVQEVRREEEFAPVKNREGEDSPATCRAAMNALHRSWLLEAGLDLDGIEVVEIASAWAEGPEEVQQVDLASHRVGPERDAVYLR